MNTRSFLLAAGFALALASIVSCSSDDGDDNKLSSEGGNAADGGNSSSSVGSGGDEISSSSEAGACPSYNSSTHFCDNRDYKVYKYVDIGGQVWMAENLNYSASGSKCYDNQDSYCSQYGRLYDWNATMSACPSGWHLPSNDEWNALYYYAAGASNTGSIYSSAGTKLKATSGWNSYSGVPNGTDEFGFAALPGGHGGSGGSFINAGNFGNWWSSNEIDANNAYRWYICYNDEDAYNLNTDVSTDESHYFSIRCLQD